jgi:hypothetical protein
MAENEDRISRVVLSSVGSSLWSFVVTKRDVSIFSRPPDSSLSIASLDDSESDSRVQMVKAVTVINGCVDDIVAHLTNPYRRRSKKDAVFESKLISR